MGVYLSSPITEKFSDDGQGRNFAYGASSMQGWRLTQEDAHNCLADFDESTKTAMLAVYDGHGGSEVAEYCALHLPDYVKKLPSYKEGRLGDALREAFLGFDATLITEEVVKELKMLANIDKGKTIERSNALKQRFYHDTSSSSSSSSSIYSPVSDEETHDENEADMLRADANIPIEELVAKYAKQGVPQVAATKKQRVEESPAIRTKKANIIGKGSGSGEDADADSTMDDMVGSSTGINKITNGHADNENNLNTEKEFKDRNSESKTNEDDDDDDNVEDKCSETDSKVNSAKDADVKAEMASKDGEAETASKDGEAETSKVDDLPGTASSSTSVSSSEMQSSSSASESIKEEKPGSSNEEPSGSGEPQPGGSGCSPSKKRSLQDFDEMDDDEDDIDEDIEGMMDDGEEDSELDETDEEYEGCDSSDENNFKEEEDEEEEEDECEEDDDYDHHNMIKESDEPGMDSGCTAVVALLRDRELVVANAGDSRCVLCQAGKAVDLSIDHKPEDEEEKQRIEAAGGKVTGDGRVNGGLNLSRAIGDHSYKQNADLPPEEQMITALPDIQSRTLDEEDEFLVLACDGIWNFMSSQEVVDFIRERLKDPIKQAKLSLICEEIFDYCLAPNTMGDGTGCDNMTCLIIDLQHRSTGSSKRTSDQLEVATDSTDKKDNDESEQSVKRPKLTDNTD